MLLWRENNQAVHSVCADTLLRRTIDMYMNFVRGIGRLVLFLCGVKSATPRLEVRLSLDRFN